MFPVDNAPQSGTHDSQADFREDMAFLNSEGDQEVNESTEESDGESEGESEERDKTKPSKKDEEGEKEGEEEKAEGEEGDKEKEEKVEEKAEPKVITRHRPSVKEITGKYPNFFKEFPDMRHMLFREAEYTNLFPTIDEAKDASERASSYDKFSDLITSGGVDDFKSFLKGVSEVDGLESMAANFLPALHAVDRDTYFKVTTPIAESVIRNAYEAGKSSGNDNLMNAALHFAKWALGDVKYATGELRVDTLKAKEAPKDDKLAAERQAFYAEKYNDTRSFVESGGMTRMKADIRAGLDPGGVFNTFTSNLLVDKVLSEVGSALEGDERHMKLMNSLWKQAEKAGFAGNWKDRLLTAYLSGARAIMPSIRTKIRSNALGQQKQQVDDRADRAEKSADRKEVRGSSAAPAGSGRQAKAPSAREVDWNRTSDMDILNDKVTLRK